MSTVVIDDGRMAPTQDPSDQVFYRFNWDDNLSASVQINTSTYTVTGLNRAGAALQIPVTSLESDGISTVTVTTTVAHGYSTQDIITIAGATPQTFNGTFAVFVSSPTVFTIGYSGIGAETATGTITAVKGIDEADIITASPYNSRYTQFRFTNNVKGAKYRIANRIVTNESPTQTKERSFDVLIEDR